MCEDTAESMANRGNHHHIGHRGYKGRVRTGCLTCRARKVKCDESRPICGNCTRLQRHCVFKPRKSRRQDRDAQPSAPRTAVDPSLTEAPTSWQGEKTLCVVAAAYQVQRPIGSNSMAKEIKHCSFSLHSSTNDTSSTRTDGHSPSSLAVSQGGQNDEATSYATVEDCGPSGPGLSTLISRDIELTTTMDILAACESSMQPSLSYFLEEVDCPLITPYDSVNWRHMKQDLASLSILYPPISSSIVALSSLFRAQLYSLPLSRAVSLYDQAKREYTDLLEDGCIKDFGVILADAFLLCLAEIIHYETLPVLKSPDGNFIRRLALWIHDEQNLSPLSLRMIPWLRLLYATTKRGGGAGLVSDEVFSLLPCRQTNALYLKHTSEHCRSDASTEMYELLIAPIFEFYYQLQGISGQIAQLTHYHRSRSRGLDQEEVAQIIGHIESQLRVLWEGRSVTQRRTPGELQSCLAFDIAEPIIKLIGVCTAAYYAEFIEMDRVLRDPLSESPRSKQARWHIREIIDGDWIAYEHDRLNPGYLRPLFLCAIECMNQEECQWAVERLERIRNPIYRSDFFASFAKALSSAQLQSGRRLTSKYFCIQHFGASPPFI